MGTPEIIAAELKRKEDLELAAESLEKLAPHLDIAEKNVALMQDSRIRTVLRNVRAILQRERDLAPELAADLQFIDELLANRPQYAGRMVRIAGRIREHRGEPDGDEPVHV